MTRFLPSGTEKPIRPATLGVSLEKIGGFATGQFDVSAAEIPAFDAASQRRFVVNAQAGRVDVLDLSDPRNPVKIAELSAGGVLAGAEINSVAVANGLVAVAIQAPIKTDTEARLAFVGLITLAQAYWLTWMIP